MDIDEERKSVYGSIRTELLNRQLSNSENYDKAILSLSTGGLVISLAFIKDIVPLEKVISLQILINSWYLFILTIVTTLISFVVSQIGIRRQLKFAEEYYLNKKEEYLNKINIPAILTEILNYLSGIFFICAIVFTIYFVTLNLNGGINMSKESKKKLDEGALIPKMQKVITNVNDKKGATISNMQPISSDQESNQSNSNQQTSTCGQASESSNIINNKK